MAYEMVDVVVAGVLFGALVELALAVVSVDSPTWLGTAGAGAVSSVMLTIAVRDQARNTFVVGRECR